MPDPMTSVEGHEAGALLRAARERRGIDIATLATLLKVPPARLQALESGRIDELPDANFARALAQAVCRALAIDPRPVLERLPQLRPAGLEKVSTGLNTPFRDRPGSVVPAEWTPWRKPALWLAAALLVGAVVFLLLPPRALMPDFDSILPLPSTTSPAVAAPSAPVATAVPGPESAPGAGSPSATVATETVAASASAAATGPATEVPDAVAPTSPTASAPASDLRLIAVRATWVQAVSGDGRVLLSRELVAGESVDLTGVPPLRLRIGNAGATQLMYRGRLVDLEPFTRDNIANVELH